MIREVEASALDETAMMAYALSTERAEQAVSDRRTALHEPAAAAAGGGCVAVVMRRRTRYPVRPIGRFASRGP